MALPPDSNATTVNLSPGSWATATTGSEALRSAGTWVARWSPSIGRPVCAPGESTSGGSSSLASASTGGARGPSAADRDTSGDGSGSDRPQPAARPARTAATTASGIASAAANRMRLRPRRGGRTRSSSSSRAATSAADAGRSSTRLDSSRIIRADSPDGTSGRTWWGGTGSVSATARSTAITWSPRNGRSPVASR